MIPYNYPGKVPCSPQIVDYRMVKPKPTLEEVAAKVDALHKEMAAALNAINFPYAGAREEAIERLGG